MFTILVFDFFEVVKGYASVLRLFLWHVIQKWSIILNIIFVGKIQVVKLYVKLLFFKMNR